MTETAQAGPDTRKLVIRLDRSKLCTTVHGERTPDDPLYRVHYRQGPLNLELPFDANGVLVPDDGKTEPWDGLDVEGKKVKYYPLYNAALRGRVERLQAQLSKGVAAMEEEIKREVGESAERMAEIEECNLESWLKGEVGYEPDVVYAAVKLRYGRAMRTVRDVVEFLVIDKAMKGLNEDDVHPRLLQAYYGDKRAA